MYDGLLNNCLPHWLRYWIYSGMWHVFPFWYGYLRAAKLGGQCDVALVPWMRRTGTASLVRLFLLCPCGCLRIKHRSWENQNFGEAMGELYRDMTDGTHDPDPVCIRSLRLNLLSKQAQGRVHLLACFLCFGLLLDYFQSAIPLTNASNSDPIPRLRDVLDVVRVLPLRFHTGVRRRNHGRFPWTHGLPNVQLMLFLRPGGFLLVMVLSGNARRCRHHNKI